MKTRTFTVLFSGRRFMVATSAAILMIAGLTTGCVGWRLEYGTPAAQFLQADLGAKGQPFIGKKITVKGTVTRTDVSDPKAAWMDLGSGIRCNFGKFKGWVTDHKVGDQVYVDGFLRRCRKDDVLIAPAMLRDPHAPFSPK